MSKKLRVLFVEDSEDDAILVQRALEQAGYACDACRVDDGDAMARALQENKWDVVLCDYNMPRFAPMQALEMARAIDQDIPFILVSGSIGEDLAVAAVKAGADDYVMKDKLVRLVPAIEREIEGAEIRRAKVRAENKLKETEKLRSLGEAAASVLHDLKNPLQIISSCTELLQAIDLPPDEQHKYVKIISEQVERMVVMTQEILDFAKGQLRLVPEAVDLSTVLRQVTESFSMLAEQRRVHLQFTQSTLDGASPVFTFDRPKLIRGVINLLDNARAATPPEGTIHIRLTIRRDDAKILIEDTGQGIAEEIIDRLFDPFATHGKPQGTGLGLCITKNIIEAHGGTITVESYKGAGTRFTITLPRESGDRLGAGKMVGIENMIP